MIKIKVLTSPIREPFRLYNGAGLGLHHFYEAENLQFECSYKDKDGTRKYPFIYEVNCKEALESYPRYTQKDGRILVVCPFAKLKTVSEFYKEDK